MTDKREFRKEVREHLKDAKATCDSVRTAAHDYWLVCDQKSALAAAVVLKAEVGNLARHIRILETLGVSTPPDLMAAVRQSSTGGDFEKAKRKRTTDDQARMADVAGALQDLITSIDMAFYRRFRPESDRRWLKYVPFAGFLFFNSDAG